MKKEHTVWTIKIPDISHSNWTISDWEEYEDNFKPIDYFGNKYDKEDWQRYQHAKEEQRIKTIRKTSGYPPDIREKDILFGKTIHKNIITAIREAFSYHEDIYICHLNENRHKYNGYVVLNPYIKNNSLLKIEKQKVLIDKDIIPYLFFEKYCTIPTIIDSRIEKQELDKIFSINSGLFPEAEKIAEEIKAKIKQKDIENFGENYITENLPKI